MSVALATHQEGGCGARFHVPKDLKKFKCPKCSSPVKGLAGLVDVVDEPLCPLSPSVGGCCLVVKPTFTTWERSTRNSFLHIGISDSKGKKVYHFLDDGAHKDSWGGQSLICIPLAPPKPETWDKVLTSHFSAELKRQKQSPYHTLNNNCYDFIVRFLNSISYDLSTSHTKEEVVQRRIAQPVGAAELFVEWLSNAKAGRLDPFPPLGDCSGESFQCDACGDCFGPRSTRFRCETCPDYDLCPDCFEGNSHEHKKFTVQATV